MRWVAQVFVFVFSGVLIHYIVRSYRDRLVEVQALGDHLSQKAAEAVARQDDMDRAQVVAHFGSWTCEFVSDVIRPSPEMCRILGLAENWTGSRDSYMAYVHPDDRAEMNGAWFKALNGASFDHEYRVVVGAATRWIRQVAEFQFAADGRPLRAVGIAQDISKRKQAEFEILSATTRLQAVLDAIPDLLFEVGLDGRIYGYHAHSEQLLAAPPESFIGKLISEIMPPDVTEVCMAAISRAAIEGTSAGEVYALQMPRGKFWFELSVAAMPQIEEQDRRFVVLARDITARKVAEDEIKNLAFFDFLTFLPNRRLLLDRLQQALSTRAQRRKSGALLFIDLDHFKDLNDTLGHNIGDLLLQQTAQNLLTCVREGDTVARLGGDEFVVMLGDLSNIPEEAATQAEAVGEKILAQLDQTYQLAGFQRHSTASVGITLFGDSKSTVDELLKQADLAMYQAKTAGRNKLHFFEPKMQTVIENRAALEAGLRDALREDQFLLHYQAQVVGKEQLTGAEVLLRWRHPQRGLIAPMDFIPLAEATGLILPLGQWVLETACTQLALWAARPEMAHLTVAVNISASQLRDSGFVDQVLEVIERTGANPRLLKLELTESMLVDNVEDTIIRMTALRAKGVRFSLDDFGTGYSSLSHLKRLPLDQLKIDQSFIKNILTDVNDAAIAKMVIALAESLGLTVIAEGVEIEGQRDCLARYGCHACQGYLISHPLPLEEFEKFAQPASGKPAAVSPATL